MAFADSENPATAGFGPGAGLPIFCASTLVGQSAGYGTSGDDGCGVLLNNTYGNIFLLPLIGGSGGAGSGSAAGRGGGAGGGALLIASSTSVTIDGEIRADGGEATTTNPDLRFFNGGGGSGGAIRLLAPEISGSGLLSAAGGVAGNNLSNVPRTGAAGRIRLEAFQNSFSGSATSTVRVMVLSPNALVLPEDVPSVRVLTVNGTAVPDKPTGSFLSPDVTINEPSTVILAIEARNVPLGTIPDPTVVTLHVFPEGQPEISVETTFVGETLGVSTYTATVTFPHGFSRFTVRALWTP